MKPQTLAGVIRSRLAQIEERMYAGISQEAIVEEIRADGFPTLTLTSFRTTLMRARKRHAKMVQEKLGVQADQVTSGASSKKLEAEKLSGSVKQDEKKEGAKKENVVKEAKSRAESSAAHIATSDSEEIVNIVGEDFAAKALGTDADDIFNKKLRKD